MGLQEFFVGVFHGSERMAVGKNRPYFLRSVELVKALQGLSNIEPHGQKNLYTKLEILLREAAEASSGASQKGRDKYLDDMFDEAIRHVHTFLQIYDSAERAQKFSSNMKAAWTADRKAAEKITIMNGRIYQMMKKYEQMKKTTYSLVHWLQPKVPSINTSDWVMHSLWSKYDVEDGITIEEFINRLLTTMITEKTSRFCDDLLLRNPRLHHWRVIDKHNYSNIKRLGEINVPDDKQKVLKNIVGDQFDLVFDFHNGKGPHLQDLIYQTFNTDSPKFPEWDIDEWKNVYWSRCPADQGFKWIGPGQKTCAYKKEAHEGHLIYRDPDGDMEHLLILSHQVRNEPLSGDEKYRPTKGTKEPARKTPPPEKPALTIVQPGRDPKPSTNSPPIHLANTQPPLLGVTVQPDRILKPPTISPPVPLLNTQPPRRPVIYPVLSSSASSIAPAPTASTPPSHKNNFSISTSVPMSSSFMAPRPEEPKSASLVSRFWNILTRK